MSLLLDIRSSTWLMSIDACFSLITGLCLFFLPTFTSDLLFTNVTDGVHWHLMRCIGGQLLGTAMVLHRLSHSKHEETHTCCFLMRIMMCTLTMIVILHARSLFPDTFQPFATAMLLAGSIVYLSLYLCHLLFLGCPLGQNLLRKGQNLGNYLYLLDSFASLIIGVAWMAFPDWLLRRQVAVVLDSSHLFLGRLMGVVFCSSHIVSSQSLYWRDPTDRQLTINARTAMCTTILAAQLWSQTAYRTYWADNHWVGIVLFSTWTIVAVWYRFWTDEGRIGKIK